MKQAIETPQTPSEKPLPISDWLKDVDANAADIIAGIRSGEIVMTSKKGIENIRQQKRDDTKKIFELSGRVAETETENAVLLSTLVSVLNAFKGVAAKGPEIVILVKAIGIDEKMTAMSFMGKLISNPSLFQKIIAGSKDVINAFDATPLSQINGEALLPILHKVGFDFTEYNTLINTFAGLQKPNENG